MQWVTPEGSTVNFCELASSRHSVRTYEPGLAINNADLKKIFDDVIQGPSSFNLQHWQFVVVRDQERKRELRKLAFGQAQVEEAAAVILVCGRLDAHVDAPRIYRDDTVASRDKFVPMIKAVYEGRAALQREEAIRSGAMAAMSLMYSAKSHGWDTGPMIGFDADKVSQCLGLAATSIPVVMVVLGRAAGGKQPTRGYRRPVSEVVRLEHMAGGALD
jgi:nitroreductase